MDARVRGKLSERSVVCCGVDVSCRWGAFCKEGGIVCEVNISLNNAGVTINVMGRGVRLIGGTDIPAKTAHPNRRVITSVTSLYGGIYRRMNYALSRINNVNVTAPNATGARANIIRCTGGLPFGGFPVTSLLSNVLNNGMGMEVTGSTGTTT